MAQAMPRLLGAGGLLPFVGLALVATLGADPWQAHAEFALLAYGVAILSFLGGVYWGMALTDRHRSLFLLSMVPFFAAWLALLVPREAGLWLLIAAFAWTFVNDRAASRLGLMPAWFLVLRRVLTSAVIAILSLTAWLA